MKRSEKLRYEASCAALLRRIVERDSPFDLNVTPLTATKKLDWLFSTVIADRQQRVNKIRMLFRGRFAEGDDVYLRMISEAQSRVRELSLSVTKKYLPEITAIRDKQQVKKTKIKSNIQ